MVARLLTRRGKWLSEWLELDPAEQEFWLAYEQQRMTDLDKVLEKVMYEKDDKRTIDPTVYVILRLLGDLV